MAKQVVSANGSFNAKLDANINIGGKPFSGDVTESSKWNGIGDYRSKYNWTFDGNGKTISGLNATTGLFDRIDTEGVVKKVFKR